MNLYENNKANWDKLAADGRPHLAEMARYFQKPSEMDRALGLNNATSHWAKGRNKASLASERAAELWLDAYHPQSKSPRANSVDHRVAHSEETRKFQELLDSMPDRPMPPPAHAPTMSVKMSVPAREASDFHPGQIGYFAGDPDKPEPIWKAEAKDIEITVKPDPMPKPGPIVRVDPLPDQVLLVSYPAGLRHRVWAILERLGCTVEEV